MELEERIALAQNWLLHSGIQDSSGAFNAWFDLNKKSYPFAYSEITGYALTTLVFLNKFDPTKGFIGRAEKAAKWLLEKAMSKEGAILARKYYNQAKADERFSFEGGNVFAFDCGMVLNGFMNLYNATGKKEYLKTGEKIANFLKEKMFEKGEMHAVYNLKSKKVLDSKERWSWQPGSYHAKLAIGLLELGEKTGNGDYAGIAMQLCENAIKLQQPNGRFETNKGNKSTHLHPHCYSAEGLLYAGVKLRESRYIEAAKKSAVWALEEAAASSRVNLLYCNGVWNNNQRSDVTAQVVRLGCALIGKEELIERKYLNKTIELSKSLISFQNTEEGNQQGGFLYGTEVDGSKRNCLNSWCTMFALQAMHWLDAIENGKSIEVELTV